MSLLAIYLSRTAINIHTNNTNNKEKPPEKEKTDKLKNTNFFCVCIGIRERVVEKSAQIKMHSISNNKQKYISI